MSDGKGIFDATHGNLLTGASSALSEESLAAAKTAMMKQKDIAGQIIRMVPRYLIVSPENEMMAKKLVTATTPVKFEDVNVFAGAFDVIVEPRLTDPKAWYLMADPYAVDSLYYGQRGSACGQHRGVQNRLHGLCRPWRFRCCGDRLSWHRESSGEIA